MTENIELLLYAGVFATGLVSTAGYYFARFYLFKDSKESGAANKEKFSAKPKPVTKTKTLTEALTKSKKSLWFRTAESGGEEVKSLDELEEALYMADIGPQTVSFLVDQVKEKITENSNSFDLNEVKDFFRAEMLDLFTPLEGELVYKRALTGSHAGESKAPYVISIVGVNGAGKTTSIGKLAHKFLSEGKKVMVVAGDTFRAAAQEQLGVWADRSKALIFKAPLETKDPGAVAFQAYEKAKKENVDILLIDTAGRLHTQDNLMKELEKVQRVLKKHDTKAPHEVWMVLDSNTGMNAFFQAESFHKTLGLTALILTKLDGSSKAGTILGIRKSLGIPIFMLGLGEGIDDMKIFEPEDFVQSLV